MIVAGIYDYLFQWQVIPVLLFMFCWVVLGGWMLQWTLKKYAQVKVALGKCSVKLLAAGFGALIVGGLVFLAIDKIGQLSDYNFTKAAVAAGTIAGLSFAFLVIYAMLDLPLKRVIKLSLPIFAILIVLGAIIFGVSIPFAVSQRNFNKGLADCSNKMKFVCKLLNMHSRATDLPENMDEITKKLKIADIVVCPGIPDKKVGYFYLRPKKSVIPANTLVFCDLGENHGGKGRNAIVFESNKYVWVWNNSRDFQALLDMEINSEFAKALKDAKEK